MDQSNPTATIASPHAVSRASVMDSLAVLKDVVLPTLGKGPLIRRRKVVGHAERQGLDDKAVNRMRALRRKYGPGPLVLPIPFRRQAVLLSADDVRLVLEGSPEPFAAASLEKRAALNHFEPDVALATHGAERPKRRRLNEDTLETACPVHSLGGHFAAIVDAEMGLVSQQALETGTLDWDSFFIGWYKMVRRIVLGDAAREDTDLTDLLEDLRHRANFAFLRRKNRGQRKALLDRLSHYVQTAEPDSLAGRMARVRREPGEQPHHQLPQYLFAFDPGAMASFRTLALLSAHPETEGEVRAELAAKAGEPTPRLETLRACYLESLRLWPTTPAILRETTRDVSWGSGQLEEATHIMIFAPFFHRDEETLPQAHVFDPALWAQGNERADLGLVPFSHGPVVCPAVNFVPLVATLALRRLLTGMKMVLNEPERLSPQRLPGTLDPYTLGFSVTAAPG